VRTVPFIHPPAPFVSRNLGSQDSGALARLKARDRGAVCSRPSPRALHLDPEFVNTPGSGAAAAAATTVAPTATAANQFLEQSVENFLETEERAASSDSEAGLTPVPVRAVPLTPGHLHAEVRHSTVERGGGGDDDDVASGPVYRALSSAVALTFFCSVCPQSLVPAGYLIPISHHSLLGYKDMQLQSRESSKATTPTYNIYHTPTAGELQEHLFR